MHSENFKKIKDLMKQYQSKCNKDIETKTKELENELSSSQVEKIVNYIYFTRMSALINNHYVRDDILYAHKKKLTDKKMQHFVPRSKLEYEKFRDKFKDMMFKDRKPHDRKTEYSFEKSLAPESNAPKQKNSQPVVNSSLSEGLTREILNEFRHNQNMRQELFDLLKPEIKEEINSYLKERFS